MTHGRMEDEFGSFEEVEIPDRNDAVWIVWCRGLLVIRRYGELGKLDILSIRSFQVTQKLPSKTNQDLLQIGRSSTDHRRTRRSS